MKVKSHQVAWKHHVVFIPKGRRKTLFGQRASILGSVFHKVQRFPVNLIHIYATQGPAGQARG